MKLTARASDVFKIEQSDSMHSCKSLDDGSLEFTPSQRALTDHRKITMKYESSGGIWFRLTWLATGVFHWFHDSKPGKLGPPTNITIAVHTENSVERAALGPNDNKSSPCYGKFLWVKTRQEYVDKRSRQVIEVDLTSINRAKLLNNSISKESTDHNQKTL